MVIFRFRFEILTEFYEEHLLHFGASNIDAARAIG